MKYYICLLSFFFFTSVCSIEEQFDMQFVKAKKIYFGSHSYICFEDKFYLHDPDCSCHSSWHSTSKDSHGSVLNHTTYEKNIFTHSD